MDLVPIFAVAMAMVLEMVYELQEGHLQRRPGLLSRGYGVLALFQTLPRNPRKK